MNIIIFPGKYYQNGGCSMAMLVYTSVSLFCFLSSGLCWSWWANGQWMIIFQLNDYQPSKWATRSRLLVWILRINHLWKDKQNLTPIYKSINTINKKLESTTWMVVPIVYQVSSDIKWWFSNCAWICFFLSFNNEQVEAWSYINLELDS